MPSKTNKRGKTTKAKRKPSVALSRKHSGSAAGSAGATRKAGVTPKTTRLTARKRLRACVRGPCT